MKTNQVLSFFQNSSQKAQRIVSVLTPENSKTWFDLANKKTHRELEQEVAMASPQYAIKERVQYVHGSRLKSESKPELNNKRCNVDKNSAPCRVVKKSQKLRKPLPANLIQKIQLRDQGRCRFVKPSGDRCSSRRFLETHHIKPLSMGGEDALDNLTLLCSGHHKSIHHQAHNSSPQGT